LKDNTIVFNILDKCQTYGIYLNAYGSGIIEENTIFGNTVTDYSTSNKIRVSTYGDDYRNYLFNNLGYNPLGYIANPIVTGETIIQDRDGNDTFANNTLYTNWCSPKSIYMQDADTFDVYREGQLIFDDVNQASVYLEPSDTFKVVFVSSLTICKTIGH